MFFSESMPLKTFIKDHYDKDKSYRLTLDSRDNTCNYTYIENVRVPNFSEYPGLGVDQFVNLIENRKWSWLLCSRFKYFYVYIIKETIYLCDRDNIRIRNFLGDHVRLEKEAEESNLPQHKWLAKRCSEAE